MMSLAPGIRSWILFPDRNGQHTYVVGSVEVDTYLVVPAAQHPVVAQILEKLPTRTPDQITEELTAQGISTDVGAFCQLLSSKGLLQMDGEAGASAAEPPPAPKRRWYDISGHLRALTWEVLSLPLGKLQRWVARAAGFYRAAVVATAVLTTLAIALSGDYNWTAARLAVREVVAHQSFVWMIVINSLMIPFFVLFHEAGHAAAAARGGVYPRKLTCRLFLLMPYFSIQLPGLYTLPLRQRLVTILAGPFVDLTLGNVMLLLARVVSPGLAPWFLFAAFANYGRGVYNLIPFIPIADGYAFMSQGLFREMDIRARAGREFRRWRRGETHHLDLKHGVFYLLNLSLVVSVLASILSEANGALYSLITAHVPWTALQPTWGWLAAIVVTDAVALYLLRKKIKTFLAW